MNLDDKSPILFVKCRLIQFRIGKHENVYSLFVYDGNDKNTGILIDITEKNRNILGKVTEGLSLDNVFKPTTEISKYYFIDGDKEVEVKPLTVENLCSVDKRSSQKVE